MKALEGVRVIDVSFVLAAPTAGRTLAEYGADVIKITYAERAPNWTQWVDTQRGKKSMLVNLQHDEGRQIFYDLVQTADIVVENFRLGVAERLRVDYETVRKIKPDIIYATVSAFGHQGPWADHPGYEPQGQAVAGIQVRNGGRDGIPTKGPTSMNDYSTGLFCAFGAMLALLERQRTGRGQHIDTALSFSATTIQSGLAIDYPGFQRRELEGPRARGWHALERLYEVSDGWIAIVVRSEAEWERLASLTEFARVARDPRFCSLEQRIAHDEALAGCLADIFQSMSVQGALDLLSGGGVLAVQSREFSHLFNDPALRDAGLVVRRHHDWLGVFDQIGLGAHLSATPAEIGEPPSFIGSDTVQVLTELLGYSDATVASLLNQGVIDTHQVPARNSQ